MSKEIKDKYLYLVIGYTGLLLIGLAVLRSISVMQDTSSYVLTMFGYACCVSYFKFADNKIGATKKDKLIFRVGFLVALLVIAFLIYD
ncbi:hypothetical protein [Tenuibacillus multivorans]|uniref:Uncharacterized protein n=1 Tax=Tenuibacillus multivorans TaxID=237069 RepID=A0A1G9YKI5_9BACI|nr:hypothetical protein [Tenuibacillus multivorans]GEL78452.1 hypothetical protein TMU01_26870 [Tenuibacillus multivorans]SDN09627.1 hypothetical protein SAMN05216498_1454 [Tenuibacillus multivorans]